MRDGSYTVTFSDGKKETAYAVDLKYTHESGYDLSDGEWVAVLFRSYAQRVLRESLLQDIEASDMFTFLKGPAEELVATNDQLVLPTIAPSARRWISTDTSIARNSRRVLRARWRR